jgi:tetratricopeptide (TPR) repeat protein
MHRPRADNARPMTRPDRAAALQELGYKAFRLGHHARARQHFTRALALLRAGPGDGHPSTWTALSDLGAACAAMGDDQAAAEAHETALRARRAALGDDHADVAVSLHNLAATRRALGDAASAQALQTEALAIWQARLGSTHKLVAKAHASLAALAHDRGDAPDAVHHAMQALAIRQHILPPDDRLIAAAHEEAAKALTLGGDHAGADSHFQAAIATLRRHPATPGAHIAALLLRIGVARRLRGDLQGAADAFAASVAQDATLFAARHQLAAALTRLGRPEQARPHRDLALRHHSIFVQDGPPGSPKILILALSDDGNIPLDHLLPEAATTRIWWFIAHAPNPAADALPPYDLVFNAIGDPDMAGPAEAKIVSFLARNTRPVLNDPARVALTRRDRLPETLGGIAGLRTPRVCRVQNPGTLANIVQAATEAGIGLPVLLRPAGAHGGDGVMRIDDWSALDALALLPHPVWYVSHVHDLRAPDGFVRKYRAIFVDGVVYPYHLAISRHWMVHYYTADMAGQAWKLAEEARFLADPAACLGPAGLAALRDAARRIGLEYCGIDFALDGDGKILVFEANATMLVHPEAETGALAFKNVAVARIVDAMRDRVRRG